MKLRKKQYFCRSENNYRMNRIKWILLIVFPALLFPACKTAKTIQRQMQGIESELFYMLTSPLYSGNIENTIYLNPVCDSTALPYTIVKKKGFVLIPLLVYNYMRKNYDVTLGNASLIQAYPDFLVDALLAECNRSSCFDLIVKDDLVLPDSAMILEVKVNKNTTTAKLISNGGIFLNPFMEWQFEGFSNWKVTQPISGLEISVRLMQYENCLFEKTYTLAPDVFYQQGGIEEPFTAYKTCIEGMAWCLSQTTKQVVENISQDLHWLVLAQ